MKVTVWGPAPLTTFETEELIVPEPFAARTVIEGDEARFVIVPVEIPRDCACQVCAPVVAVAVPVL